MSLRPALSLLSLLSLLAVLTPGAEAAKPPAKPAPAAPVAPPPPPPDPEAWRATPPGPGGLRGWSLPDPKVAQLQNGVPVYAVQGGDLPLVTVRLHMNLGREVNPAGKAGLGALVADLLDEGTGKGKTAQDALSIAAQLQSLGAALSISANNEGVDVTLDALTSQLDASLDLLARVVLQPSFAKADVARVQEQILADLSVARTNPAYNLRRVTAAQLYGPEHPYGALVGGSPETVGSITHKDVRSFYKQWWHAGYASFVVVGAISPEDATRALDARFGAWTREDVAAPVVEPPAALLKTRVVFVEQPGSVQSMIGVASPALSRNAPDWHASNVAATIVAGMFSSPLNMVLREEKGWSYGAYGGISESRDYGIFFARTSVQADKTAPAVSEILKVLQDAATTAPSEEMIAMARDYLRKSLPGNFDTNANMAATFAAIPTFKLQNDAWRSYDRDVNNITASRALTMASRWFRPERQLIVVVGPRTAKDAEGKDVDTVAALKALGFDYVEVQ